MAPNVFSGATIWFVLLNAPAASEAAASAAISDDALRATSSTLDTDSCQDDGCVLSLLQMGVAHKSFRKEFFKPRASRSDDVELVSGKRSAQCDVAGEDCQSLCRVLKMTNEEQGNGQCPLFEWSLKTCGYIFVNDREAGTELSPLDCVVNTLRSTLQQPEIEDRVANLEKCIDKVPKKLKDQCNVAMDLVSNEVKGWRVEWDLKENVRKLKQNLIRAIEEAKVASDTKAGEQLAMDHLTTNLTKAEKLPGFYMSEQIHKARTWLDKLGPIPPVRDSLDEAMIEGRAALESKAMDDVKKAMTAMDVAINDGEDLHLLDPLPQARAIMANLTVLDEQISSFKRAVLQGNVSLGTRSAMDVAIPNLNASISTAMAQGISEDVDWAKSLLKMLVIAEDAYEALKLAVQTGKWVLASGGKGLEPLENSIKQLNVTIDRAHLLTVGDDDTAGQASDLLTQLQYVYNARKALHEAVIQAHHVVARNGSDLSDDAEEGTIDLLEPAIKWSTEVDLKKGVPVASKLLAQLSRIQAAKENMSFALARGNASNISRAGEDEAVPLLKDAILGVQGVNISAGVAPAEELLRLLWTRYLAKLHMRNATELAMESLRTGVGADLAIGYLNRTIAELNRTGLSDEALLANLQLSGFADAWAARQNLTGLLDAQLPNHNLSNASVNDTQPIVQFNRTGYIVKDLPDVVGGDDDGDRDFQEHIMAIENAIAAGKEQGFVDPEMDVQLEEEQGLERAYKMAQAAIAAGNESIDSIEGMEDATSKLVTAISEGRATGLKIGLARAVQVLGNVRRIQPAMDELVSAMEMANISLKTISHMGDSLVRINAALIEGRDIGLTPLVRQAVPIRDRVELVKSAYVSLKAAIMHGQIALDREQGEEAAIDGLRRAIETAKGVGLHRDMPVAVDVMSELLHMNAEHQRLAEVVNPLNAEP